MFKKILVLISIAILAFGLYVTFGPREPIDETISFDESALPPAAQLDDYLIRGESKRSDITPGAEKQIVWNDPNNKSKTPISLVYLHGFSATLEETRPMTDLIAQKLGANIYYARLSGHGRGGDAMAEPSVNDWFNDTAEALAIGRAIGEQVIVIAASTGATFASWAATKPDFMQNVQGIIMVSPNFGLNNPLASILTLGGARTWIPILFGKERSFETSNAEHAKWWTSTYPTVAVLPMAASVKFVNQMSFEDVTTPALFILHPDDDVVRSDISLSIAERWGRNTDAAAEIFKVLNAEDPHNHVIAGRVLSPSNSQPLADKSFLWIENQ